MHSKSQFCEKKLTQSTAFPPGSHPVINFHVSAVSEWAWSSAHCFYLFVFHSSPLKLKLKAFQREWKTNMLNQYCCPHTTNRNPCTSSSFAVRQDLIFKTLAFHLKNSTGSYGINTVSNSCFRHISN